MESTLVARQASGENVTYNMYKILSNPVFLVIGSLVLAASIVWFVLSRKKKVDESRRLFTSTNALSLALYLTAFVLCFGTSNINVNFFFSLAYAFYLANVCIEFVIF